MARLARSLTLVLLTLLVLSLSLDTAAGGKRSGGRRGRRNKRGNDKCSSASVAEYKLTFHGDWSKDKFPRMYPTYRPCAQWSKLIGRTHAPTYHIWSEGTFADPALKRFAESGDALLYDSQPQGYHGIYDTFYCDPIKGGEGKTSTFILADGAHSKVSFIVKMVPSPDWFVGVDGLELCRRGRWRARAHVNLRPMDAGTDRGYTFTSPSWPSHPRETIYQITSSRPDHPASAFLYPEYRKLPRVAYVQVERVAQYWRRGAVSPVKGKAGPNVVVFGQQPSTTLPSTTTTTTALNASLAADNATDTLNSTELVSASETGGRADHGTEGNLSHQTLANALPQQKQTPAPTTQKTTTTTTTTSPTTRTTITTTRKAPVGTTTLASTEAPGSEADKTEAPENDIAAYQDDDAHAKTMVNDHHHHAWPAHNAESLNESHRKHGTEDSTKAQSLKSSLATKVLPGDQDDVQDPLPDPPSSLQLGAQDSAATARLFNDQQPTSRLTSTALTSSSSAKSASSSDASSQRSSATTQQTSVRRAPATTAISKSSQASTLAMRPASSVVASESPVSSSSRATSSTSARTVATTKAAPRTPSPRQAVPQSAAGSRERAEMRANTAVRRRWRTGTVEPAASQSPHTFDEPQFVEVAVTDPYQDSLPVDCRVEEWSEWSQCSKSCGFGVRVRTRDVISYSRNGGFGCPVLEQEALCGSMRSCRWKHFSFIGGMKRPRSERVRRRRHHHDQAQRDAERRRRYYYK